MQNRPHTKARCCGGCRADSIFLIHAGQGHLVVLVRAGSIRRPWCPGPQGALGTVRLRCNQSKNSCSSRHPGSRPSGRHSLFPPPYPSVASPPLPSSRAFLARWRAPWHLPSFCTLPPFFLGGSAAPPSADPACARCRFPALRAMSRFSFCRAVSPSMPSP